MEEQKMLSESLRFNLESTKNYGMYSCKLPNGLIEREISFHVTIGPSTKRRGDIFPFYKVPGKKYVELTDWSFLIGWPENRKTSIGGSIGRIINGKGYMILLNCSAHVGQTKLFSPARSIRYLDGEWMALCFHHMGEPIDTSARATFRFIEHPVNELQFQASYTDWWGKNSERFDYEGQWKQHGI